MRTGFDERVNFQPRDERGAARVSWTLLIRVTAILAISFLAVPGTHPQARTKNVLILSESALSHPLTSLVAQQILNLLPEEQGRYVEFYSERLDLLAFPDKPSIADKALPAGSFVLFRDPSLWERTKWMWLIPFLIILGLSGLVIYFHFSRKQLEHALQRHKQLSRMLINAGEKERSRVANELHDDFSQRLAVMALKLQTVSEVVAPLSREAEEQLRELLSATGELGADLHSLSHRLHSSTLQSLGLSPAVTALCKEFSAQESVKTEVSCEEIPRSVHSDVALCAFRIVQEGLLNIKKHSGASFVKVWLHKKDGRLLVTVQDNGCGFDPSDACDKEGLGLRAMEERASLLGGKFTISSVLGTGTVIEAGIPLNPPAIPKVDTLR